MERLSLIHSLSFDEYINLCVDLDFISELSSLLNISKNNVRTFLTAYVFKYFPFEIMSPNIRSPEDISIISLSESLILSIENNLNFPSLLQQYIDQFVQWKEFDRPRAVNPFINKYKNLRLIRDIDPTHYYKKELKLLIDMTFLQLIAMINSIGGEEALSRIDSSNSEVEIDEPLKEEFISSSKETFWTTFREELPKYDKVIILLRDFATRYQSIIPNRIDLLEQMGEILDIDFIQQRLDTQNITVESIVIYMDYIVTKTKEIDTPSEDEITDRWFNNLKTSPIAISDPIYLIQTFFEYIFNRLDIIKKLSIEMTPTIRQIYEARYDRVVSE